MTFHEAFPYVAGAYLSVWVLILAYVAIIGRNFCPARPLGADR